jgi:hypothetical protein
MFRYLFQGEIGAACLAAGPLTPAVELEAGDVFLVVCETLGFEPQEQRERAPETRRNSRQKVKERGALFIPALNSRELFEHEAKTGSTPPRGPLLPLRRVNLNNSPHV